MSDPRLEGTEIAESVIELIGNTPLVRMKRTSELEGIECTLAMKMETTNPGGSSKDRPALEMILAAEDEGLLTPGGTIVEPTSGNTGVGLAIVAAHSVGYQVRLRDDRQGRARRRSTLLKSLWRRGRRVPGRRRSREDPQSYYSRRRTPHATNSTRIRPNQYAQPCTTREAHVKTTGPEVWRQTDGRITHFVAGAGTCGSITGTGRYLKSMNPDIKIIAADPEGSVFSGGSGRPYLVEGVGEDFFPAAYERRSAGTRSSRSAMPRASASPATSARPRES